MSRRLAPFGGGVLVGVAVLWILPETAREFQWPAATAWSGAGLLILWLIDRYVYPVCPACSASHRHDLCADRLHGFAAPLLAAAALHSALDGWGVRMAADEAGIGAGLLAGIAAHKIPEGLALGVIARAALPSRRSALIWCALAQLATPAGAILTAVLAPAPRGYAPHAMLALAAGSFLYLGGHAVHGEVQRSGARPAILPALTGVAGSSVLRILVR
jgi:zinc transporter ZupT